MTCDAGHEIVVGREDGWGLPPDKQERIVAVMERDAVHVGDFFSTPNDQVVEIGAAESDLNK